MHLDGFIIKKFVTMHGHMNIKKTLHIDGILSENIRLSSIHKNILF